MTLREFHEGKRKIALVSWEQVCFPKKSGGLNVKGCKNLNIASAGNCYGNWYNTKLHLGSSRFMAFT